MKFPCFTLLLGAVIFASGCGPGGCGLHWPSHLEDQKQAPDFSLFSLERQEQRTTLSEWTAKGPVLLVFWASWCPPCVQEIPVLNEIRKSYSEDTLKILAVNVGESRETLTVFRQSHSMDYDVLLDTEGVVASKYDIVGLPVAVFLAKGGEILYYGFTLPRVEDFPVFKK